MRITLISTYLEPVALGLRYVSACLKAAAHEVEMIFLSPRCLPPRADLSRGALEAVVERLYTCDVIGMSVMTDSLAVACVLTDRIRRAGVSAPIVWGGAHPTAAARACLEIADVVCVGEGEEAIVDFIELLAAGNDPLGVSNLGFRGGGPFGNKHSFRNPMRRPGRMPDGLPFPDYAWETQWLLREDGLVSARPENLRDTMHRLCIETTRACVHPDAPTASVFPHRPAQEPAFGIRERSTANIIAEIEEARRHFPAIATINIVDDLFFWRREEAVEQFATEYSRRVNLPLEFDTFPSDQAVARIRCLAARVPIGMTGGFPGPEAGGVGRQLRAPHTLPRRHRVGDEVEQPGPPAGVLHYSEQRA